MKANSNTTLNLMLGAVVRSKRKIRRLEIIRLRLGQIPSRQLAVLILLVFASFRSSYAQTVINFNGLADGTLVTTQYQNLGVTFSSSEPGGPQARITGGAIPGPDYLCPGPTGASDQFNGSITATFSSPVTSFSSSIADGPTMLTGYAANGQTQTLSYGGGSSHAALNLNPSFAITKAVFTGTFYCVDFVSFKAAACQTNVARLSQGNPQWASNLYDHSNSVTIQEKGCALTSLSMALNTAGFSNNPGSLNQSMTATDTDYSGLSVNWGPATRDASGGSLKFHVSSINSVTDLQSATQYLDNAVCQGGNPVIVGVNLDAQGTPGHFVVVTGKQGNDYTIADPGFSNTILSQYGNQFVTRGFVADPAGDISELDLTIGDVAEMLLIDASGKKTGYDPSTAQVLQQIPKSAYFRDSLQNDLTGALPTETIHFAEVFQPAQETYQVAVSGIILGTYSLSSRMFSQDGSSQQEGRITGIAGPGSTSLFAIQLNSTPGASSRVVRVATFQSTLSDVNNSLQLGLIDNQGIANSLSQELQAAASAATQETKANILNAFKNEINAQSGKHITAVAAQTLLQDADSLLSQ